MNAIAFLDHAAALENTLSATYEALAEKAEDNGLALELKKLQQEEGNHSRVIEAGKNYVRRAPDLFGKTIITEEELIAGLEATRSVLKDIRFGVVNFREALVIVHRLETELEKIHMAMVMAVKDESLRNLFQQMAHDDRDHRLTLDDILQQLDRTGSGRPSA
jgi:rubrerythrin